MVASSLKYIEPIAGHLRREFSACLRLEDLGVVEFARTIRLPDGDFEGDLYEPSRHPAQICLLEAIEAGARWVAVAKPVQDGGSLATTVPILRRVSHLHQKVMVAYPTQEKGKDAWTAKTWPMLEAQGGMQPRSGGGSRGGAARVATLPGGGQFMQRSAGGRGQSGQAGDTVHALQIEELDDWEREQVRRIERRINKSPDPFIEFISTVKKDIGSLILRLFELGTGTTIHYACPHCDVIQRFEWEQVDVDRAVIKCLHCPEVITEAQRQQALKKWHRRDARKTHKFSILWTALDSPFPIVVDGMRMAVLPGLCAEYKMALEQVERGDHSAMRQFERDRLVRGYTKDLQKSEDESQPLTHGVLAERSKITAWSVIGENKSDDRFWARYMAEWPEPAEFAVAAIDVQHNRLYWTADGFAKDERSWDIGWGIEYAHAGTDTQQPPPFGPGEFTAVANRLADYIEAQFGDRLRIGVMDTGDQAADFADEMEAWLKTRARWRACRGIDLLPKIKQGTDTPQAYEERIPGLVCWEKLWRPELGRYVISSQGSWRAFQAAHRRAPGTPGAAHLPGPIKSGNAYLRHLTAQGEVKNKSGAMVWKEQPGGGRHDYGDCRGYTHAVGLALIREPPPPPPTEPFRLPSSRRINSLLGILS